MNEPVFEKPEGALHDWEIFNALGKRFAARLGLESRETPPPRELINRGLQADTYYSDRELSLEVLAENPSGIDLGPLQSQLPERLFTAEKKIHCDTPEPLADIDRLWKTLTDSQDTLRLIGRRHVRDCNSWMHNYHRLIKGKNRCTVMMHPDDMSARGIADTEMVTVRSRAGEVRLPAQSTEEMMPGVVSIPHGYGHHREGIRTDIASAHAGVSCNDITDDLALDALSGNAAVNGVPVEVLAGMAD